MKTLAALLLLSGFLAGSCSGGNSCPSTPPEPGGPCTGDLHCTWGRQCCTSVTGCGYPTECWCGNGEWSCLSTDCPPEEPRIDGTDGDGFETANDAGGHDASPADIVLDGGDCGCATD